LDVLRAKLGWSSDSDARAEVLARFTPVARAVFQDLAPSEQAQERAPATAVPDTLAEFESWYAGSRPAPFWVLFEQYIPETPRVDF
jgi:hypothetical protein